MTSYDGDALVSGSGRADESAALNPAKHHQRAAVFEDRASVGGGCTHRGTISSKALRNAVKQHGQGIKKQDGPGNCLRYFINYPAVAKACRIAGLNRPGGD